MVSNWFELFYVLSFLKKCSVSLEHIKHRQPRAASAGRATVWAVKQLSPPRTNTLLAYPRTWVKGRSRSLFEWQNIGASACLRADDGWEERSGGEELAAEFIYPRRRRIQRGKHKHSDPTGLQSSLSMCLSASVSKYDLIKFEANPKSPVGDFIRGRVASSFVLELICANVVFKEQLFTPHLSCPPPTVNKEGLLWSHAGSKANTHICTVFIQLDLFPWEVEAAVCGGIYSCNRPAWLASLCSHMLKERFPFSFVI